MTNTSIGYHTFTIFMQISEETADIILSRFKKYSKETGEIKIYPLYRLKSDESDYSAPRCLKIEYIGQDRGISWLLRFSNQHYSQKSCTIEAKINPKIFLGIEDYISAASEECLDRLEKMFNRYARKTYGRLGEFRMYNVKRIDFCINFDLAELGIECTPNQMMTLLKRSDIPRHYEEYQTYNGNTHRKVADKNSYYLKSGSVNINCYWKYWQLQNEYPDNPSLQESLNVIRFEIQLKYRKTYAMRRNLRDELRIDSHILFNMFSDETAGIMIYEYYKRIIKLGDYYTLQGAVDRINSMKYRVQRHDRLIKVLELINTHRGIYKARIHLEQAGLSDYDFNQSLLELSRIGINPVTIPREWGIKFIPGLLEEFRRRKS